MGLIYFRFFFFLCGEPLFIGIYPLEKFWRVLLPHINLSRCISAEAVKFYGSRGNWCFIFGMLKFKSKGHGLSSFTSIAMKILTFVDFVDSTTYPWISDFHTLMKFAVIYNQKQLCFNVFIFFYSFFFYKPCKEGITLYVAKLEGLRVHHIGSPTII